MASLAVPKRPIGDAGERCLPLVVVGEDQLRERGRDRRRPDGIDGTPYGAHSAASTLVNYATAALLDA
jgi:hypothetical protein